MYLPIEIANISDNYVKSLFQFKNTEIEKFAKSVLSQNFELSVTDDGYYISTQSFGTPAFKNICHKKEIVKLSGNINKLAHMVAYRKYMNENGNGMLNRKYLELIVNSEAYSVPVPKHMQAYVALYIDVIKSCAMQYGCIEKWKKYMKVYQFDRELENILLDEFELDPAILKKLPFTNFYIQKTEDSIFSDYFQGAFVNIQILDNGNVSLYIYRTSYHDVDKDSEYLGYICAYTWEFEKQPNGMIKIVREKTLEDMAKCFYLKEKAFNPLTGRYEEKKPDSKEFIDFHIFVMNAIYYLCCSNKDVKVSNQNAYKPRQAVKNIRYTDLEFFDCGFTYGSSIRKNRQEKTSVITLQNRNTKSTRKPHPVGGHYQKYHTGKGRKNTEVKFIAPYFTGMEKCNFATISKVRA